MLAIRSLYLSFIACLIFLQPAFAKREVPTYLFANNARPAVIIQLGENPSELSRSLYQIVLEQVKTQLNTLGIKPLSYHNIELKNDFWFSNLNKELQEDKVNYLIVLTARRLPPSASQFKKLKAYSEASLHIGLYTHDFTYATVREGSYVLDENGNFEEMMELFAKEVNDIKKKEPLYFETEMYIPEFHPVAKNRGSIYADLPKELSKEKFMFIKLDRFDTPDWAEHNKKNLDIMNKNFTLPYVEIRKNQIDEYKNQGYRYLIEPFNEVVFGDDGKGNKGFTTFYYYYLRDSKNDDKFNISNNGYPSLDEALDSFIRSVNASIAAPAKKP